MKTRVMLIGLFLLAGLASGPQAQGQATFYVDATNGNDSNAGRAENQAWKTLAQLRRTIFSAGDTILLKRGEVWPAETLLIGNSLGAPPPLTNGADGAPIQIDAYGMGENPRVYMLHVNRTAYLELRNLTVTKRVVDSEYPVKVQYGSHVAFEDCSFPGLYTDYSDNVILRRVVSSNNTMEHGLYLCTQSRAFVIEDCVFANNRGSGIQTNGDGMDDIVVRRCLIYGNGIAGYNDVRSHNVTFANNVFCSGVGKAIEIQQQNSGNRYFNNLIVSKTAGVPAATLAAGITLKNNVFYVPTDAFCAASASTVIDSNCFYAIDRPDHKPIINWGTTYESWRTSSRNDAHSLVVDPRFASIDLGVDPPAWDLHLLASSPLIDAGTDVGLGYQGTAPDIGTLETGDPSPPALPPTPSYSRLINLSARVRVGTDADVLIPGFIIGGAAKRLLIRAVGPSLEPYGISDYLPDPVLELRTLAGALITTNDNWNAADAATMTQVGAFSLPAASRDAAVVVTLQPGMYTAVVSDRIGRRGVGLVELYDLEPGTGRLSNLSARARVGTGAEVLIPGVIVDGNAKKRLLIRAAGPALQSYGINDCLADPQMEIKTLAGTTVATNDNWNGADTTLTAAFTTAGAFAFLPGSRDAALVVELDPGLYTVVVRGIDGTTGVALAEIYELP